MAVTVLFCAIIVLSAAAEPKQTAPAGYIYTHSVGGMTYGQPKELRAIRQRLTLLCTGGRKLPGLGPGVASELIQIGSYAIAEGSCGNPELHLILKKSNGLWQTHGPRCGLGGGVNPDYGRYGVYNTLVNYCAFPVPVVCRIIAIRSQLAGMTEYDKREGAPEKACSNDSSASTSKPTPATSKPMPATRNPTPTPSNTNLVPQTPPPCARPHMDVMVTRAVEPNYPETARKQGATGTVQVMVVLSPTGEVITLSVYRSSGNAELDGAALAAARASTYSPEIEDCRPVGGRYLFRADFSKQ